MRTNKKIYMSMAFLLIGILMISSVLAFAVSSKYWEDNPITINPGETQKAFIVLQNVAGTEPINARVGILSGSDIATMDTPDALYEIPAGGKLEVNFTVSVPADSSVGGTENIVFDVSTVSQQSEGPMSFGSGAQKLIPVLITEKPKAPLTPVSTWIYYIIAGIVLLGIVVLVILKRKKK
jgi:LPXTG-motif cell wall-anchored protein